MSNELLMQAFMADVEHELNHARQKYPDWPSSPQKAVGVLMKQAGMLTVVAYDLEHKPGDRIECLADMRKYTARTAAMAYRVMNGCGQ